MAGLASDPDAEGDTPNDTLGALVQGTPRWVKIFGIVIVVLVLLFVALHLTGHGFSSHSPPTSGAQRP